ncbi:MAG: TIGR03905 family TSCPD domain-containing protein [Ruminococcaceae bacterium]|nr:TIGR03905 family TSCPD domain-containing protein [Oscillospiraceae bacterium]
MDYHFKPKGVCARQIDFSVEDGVITNINFIGGCSGNTQGLSRLCIGRKPEEIKELLSGIKCGFKSTSCPDQLAKAMDEIAN